MDSSVVFDPKGYLPREVNLNLTVHLFGKRSFSLCLEICIEASQQLILQFVREILLLFVLISMKSFFFKRNRLEIVHYSYNVFEIGGRAEGLEPVHDDLLGADGYITNPNGHVFREKKYRFHNDKANQMKELFFRHGDYVENRVTASYYFRVSNCYFAVFTYSTAWNKSDR